MTAPLSLVASLRLLLCEEPDLVACAGTGLVPLALVLDAVGRIPVPEVSCCRDCDYNPDGTRRRCCTRHRTAPFEGAGGRKTAPPLPSTAAVGRAAQAVRRTTRQQRSALRYAQVERMLRAGKTHSEIRAKTHTGYPRICAIAAALQ